MLKLEINLGTLFRNSMQKSWTDLESVHRQNLKVPACPSGARSWESRQTGRQDFKNG